MNIHYGDFSSTSWLSEPLKAKLNVLQQVVIFSQSWLYAIAFWFMAQHTEYAVESAIYGLMVGSISTFIIVSYQCHSCSRLAIRLKAQFSSFFKTILELTKAVTPVLMLTLITY